jgi:hypothetical protein
MTWWWLTVPALDFVTLTRSKKCLTYLILGIPAICDLIKQLSHFHYFTNLTQSIGDWSSEDSRLSWTESFDAWWRHDCVNHSIHFLICHSAPAIHESHQNINRSWKFLRKPEYKPLRNSWPVLCAWNMSQFGHYIRQSLQEFLTSFPSNDRVKAGLSPRGRDCDQ